MQRIFDPPVHMIAVILAYLLSRYIMILKFRPRTCRLAEYWLPRCCLDHQEIRKECNILIRILKNLLSTEHPLGEMCKIITCGFPFASEMAHAYPTVLADLHSKKVEQFHAGDFNKWMEGDAIHLFLKIPVQFPSLFCIQHQHSFKYSVLL